MGYTMFIDDERLPVDDSSVVCRSFQEAVECVKENGCPTHVDFDHDLGDGPSGYDFAKWLVENCLDGGGFPDTFSVHSQNPVGKNNIESLMNNFKETKENGHR